MRRTITLIGGPADGRTVDASGAVMVEVPELIPAERAPTETDRFVLYPDGGFARWVDTACNQSFRRHRYNMQGVYLGAVDE